MLTLVSLAGLALLIGLTVRGGVRDVNRAVEGVQRDRLTGWDPRVERVWECPVCGMRVGFGGCTSAPPKCSGAWHPEQVEMEQVLVS